MQAHEVQISDRHSSSSARAATLARARQRTNQGQGERSDRTQELVEILRWHVDRLPEGPMEESELPFPSTTGGFRAPSVLDKPFRAVVQEMTLSKKIAPRAMRRTFKDVAREAEVRDIVSQAIAGHHRGHAHALSDRRRQRDGGRDR